MLLVLDMRIADDMFGDPLGSIHDASQRQTLYKH